MYLSLYLYFRPNLDSWHHQLSEKYGLRGTWGLTAVLRLIYELRKICCGTGRDGQIEGSTRGPRGPKKGLRGQRLPGTVLLRFFYQKEESSKWRKWKYHYVLEESKKDQSICVTFPNIFEYIPKHRKEFEMDPNIIPSQIPTGVNKIKVSWCNTWKGKYWHCQEGGRILTLAKKCGSDKRLRGRVILKMASENFWPAPNPPKKGVTTFPKRGLFPSILKPPWPGIS